jgi:hypothetical protein
VPAGLAVLAILGLLAAGSRHVVVRTASADVPNQFPMPALRPGRQACEGPLTSHGPARSVGFWGAAASPLAQLTVTVRDATTHAIVASGSLAARSAETEWVAHLRRQVPGGLPLEICVADEAGTFSLAGSLGGAPGVVATGTAPRNALFSLATLDAGNHSLLSALPTAFARASLWRPSWVGSWTFWVLTAVVLATFGLGVVAVVNAADEDEPPPPPGPDGPGPADPSPDERSESREDRAQTVS